MLVNERGNVDYKAELDTSIDLLNSENGKIIACNYPARYLWIKSHGFSVQLYNLETCTELNEYVSNFQKSSLSLVFVSELIDSPQSAFGHILLVFHDSANTGVLAIDDSLPDKVKEALAIGYEYSFRRYRKIKPQYDNVLKLKFDSSILSPPVTIKSQTSLLGLLIICHFRKK